MVLGKEYKLSAGKLLNRCSVIMPNPEERDLSDKTFFCSELVAAGYKFLGLLDPVKSCSQYWPGNKPKKKNEICVTYIVLVYSI